MEPTEDATLGRRSSSRHSSTSLSSATSFDLVPTQANEMNDADNLDLQNEIEQNNNGVGSNAAGLHRQDAGGLANLDELVLQANVAALEQEQQKTIDLSHCWHNQNELRAQIVELQKSVAALTMAQNEKVPFKPFSRVQTKLDELEQSQKNYKKRFLSKEEFEEALNEVKQEMKQFEDTKQFKGALDEVKKELKDPNQFKEEALNEVKKEMKQFEEESKKQFKEELNKVKKEMKQFEEESKKQFKEELNKVKKELKDTNQDMNQIKEALKQINQLIEQLLANQSKESHSAGGSRKDLEFSGFDCLMVNHRGYWGNCSAVIKCQMPKSGTFYYEVKIVSKKGDIAIGFATKQKGFAGLFEHYECTYAYESNGNFWGHATNGSRRNFFIRSYIEGKPEFGSGDTVGCGVNLATRRIVYTKNGKRLDYGDLSVDCADLFPCATLFHSGDKIESNFGPDFKFKKGF
uniref:B30.2/SPRY domain-containing protein n=1 Tax=Globodera rostochiensis TaxID=31243 RepID=A0A914HLL4_GLORO